MSRPADEGAARPPRSPHEHWRRNRIAITLGTAMVFLGFSLVMPFLPFYVRTLGVEEMGDVALWSGILLTVTPLLAAIMGPIWGRLADRIGMKIMVTRVIFAMTVHWGLMYFATSIWHVLALRIFLGLFSGFGVLSVALVTQGAPRDRIGGAIGSLKATQILCTAVGPFIGGMLAEWIGIRHTFLLTFVLCAGAFVFVLFLYRDVPRTIPPAAVEEVVVPQEGPVAAGVRAIVTGGDHALRDRRPTIREILALPMFLSLLPFLFLLNLVERTFTLSVPLAMQSFLGEGGSLEATTGMVVSAGAFAGALSAWLLGRLVTRWSPLTLLSWSLVGGLVTILPMALCREVLPFALLRVLLGLASGGAATLTYTFGGQFIPDSVRASGYSLLSACAMLGGSMGPIVCSGLTAIDLRANFIAGGLIYLVLVVLVMRLIGRTAERGRPIASMP